MKKLFTSESVTEGHPDKVCDQISDAVLDAILAQDPMARVACECSTCTGLVLVMGEITTNCYVDIAGIARDTITKIGYDNAEFGFDGRSCAVLTAIDKQSEDIAMGVDASYDDANQEGAGDQGMMFGFACNETKELMPAPISYAHNLTKALTKARKDGRLPWLRPDGKSQVSVQYGEHGEVQRIDTVVVSTQHAADIAISDLREAIVEEVIKPNLPSKLLDGNTKFLVNPTGRFVIGGPVGDSGLTGRKIIVDTYGGYAAHGGGAFSGKDPTKVDRSAAYAARHVAKNIVAAGLAEKCTVSMAYAIGKAEPLYVQADTHGTSVYPDAVLAEAVKLLFDLTPTGMANTLQLMEPIYQKYCNYGHFTHQSAPWEQTDCAELLWEGCDLAAEQF